MEPSLVAAGAVAASAVLALASLGAYAQAKKWYPFTVEEHDPPFDMSSPVKEVKYSPLEKADKKWNICVSFPHMKTLTGLPSTTASLRRRRSWASRCI